MILIIGGAYQGKLDFAKKQFSLESSDIFTCKAADIDFSKRCIYGIEEYTYACIQAGMDPLAHFQSCREDLENSILICQDIFCGVVPLERELRLWRDATGKLCQYLSREADQVYRVFCGLEQRLK